MKEYHERLHKLREHAGLTVEQTARHLDVSPEEYAAMECGRTEICSEHLIKLAALYGVSIDYLICVTDRPEHL